MTHYELRPKKRVRPPMPCPGDCGRTTVTEWAWRSGQRQGADTYTQTGDGLCRRCKMRERRAGRERRTPVTYLNTGRSREDIVADAESLLEEYDLIRPGVDSIRQAAARMGVSFTRLDKLLYRARKRGDDRGRPPSGQRIRAERHGMPYTTLQREAS